MEVLKTVTKSVTASTDAAVKLTLVPKVTRESTLFGRLETINVTPEDTAATGITANVLLNGVVVKTYSAAADGTLQELMSEGKPAIGAPILDDGPIEIEFTSTGTGTIETDITVNALIAQPSIVPYAGEGETSHPLQNRIGDHIQVGRVHQPDGFGTAGE